MQKMQKILVAYDGSPHSKEALNWAIDLSIMSGAEVAAVKVFEKASYSSAEFDVSNYPAFIDAMRTEGQRLIDEMIAVGQVRGVNITGELLQGNIAGEILSYAKQNNFDLIIAGTKGHGALAELLMGSVTSNLVSLAHVPVLVVKD